MNQRNVFFVGLTESGHGRNIQGKVMNEKWLLPIISRFSLVINCSFAVVGGIVLQRNVHVF